MTPEEKLARIREDAEEINYPWHSQGDIEFLIAALDQALAERDEARREICEAAGKRWAHPMTGSGLESWERARHEGARAEAERRGWELAFFAKVG